MIIVVGNHTRRLCIHYCYIPDTNVAPLPSYRYRRWYVQQRDGYILSEVVKNCARKRSTAEIASGPAITRGLRGASSSRYVAGLLDNGQIIVVRAWASGRSGRVGGGGGGGGGEILFGELPSAKGIRGFSRYLRRLYAMLFTSEMVHRILFIIAHKYHTIRASGPNLDLRRSESNAALAFRFASGHGRTPVAGHHA